MKFTPIAVAVALTSAVSLNAQAATPPDSLVMAWNIDAISTWDPAQIGEVVTSEIYANTCDALVDFDVKDEKKLTPAMAKRWDVSPDRKTLTFHLQDNLKFPDGTPASAGDLAWSMQRVVKLGYGNAAQITGIWLYQRECRQPHYRAGRQNAGDDAG